MKKKVICAMSGGVDSSVAALLLKEQGYDVIGITLQIWDRSECGQSKSKACCRLQDIEDARRICAKLKIPFYVINAVDEFKKDVIEYFCSEYKIGRTPNPCIICNEKIKFGFLLNKANQLGAEFIATGHYAKVEFNSPKKRYILKEGKDKLKDQSYVLFSLTQKQLSKTIFLLGAYKKSEVRQIAKENNLGLSRKLESQDICFIRERNYADFLKKRYPHIQKEGNVVDVNGRILGRHKGIAFYTIGQREGLGIALGRPMFVVKIDVDKNEVILADKEALYADELIADNPNWISIKNLGEALEVEAKIRYQSPKRKALIWQDGDSQVKVKFLEGQDAITPGQAVVFYDEDIVVGGGWIK